LHHERGLKPSPAIESVYANRLEHDPSNIHRAREIASAADVVPVGILFHDPSVPCYEDLRQNVDMRTTDVIRRGLEAELDRFTI
jgi:2-oxoglutarate ferredoxin oxidoreductase subunit beta